MKLHTASKQIFLVCTAVSLLAGLCFSQAKVSLSPLSGPPTTNVLVSGSGFAASAAIDIYFDTTDLALAVTGSTGSFSKIAIQVPASALPGTHTVTAVARSSGAAAQKAFLVRTNWAQFRFTPRHKSRNLFENVLSPATVGGIDLHWSFTAGNFVNSSPAVSNGVVYVGSHDHNVYALNGSTGAKLWSFATGDFVFSSPAVANGVVYVGSFDDNVYALNASTGARLWSFTTGSLVESSPAVANGVVYVGSFDRNVYALNASTGALLWSFATGSDVESSPAVANGVVYVGSDDKNLYALNASTGALLWSFTTGSFVFSSPAVANGVVYVGSEDEKVYAFDQTGGALARTTRTAQRRPDPKTLRPNFNLKMSKPVATLPRNGSGD